SAVPPARRTYRSTRSRPSIVVEDRAEPLVLLRQRGDNPAELDIERFVGLLLPVPLDLDGDRLARLSRGEREGAGRGHVLVVARPGRAVGRGVVDRHLRVVGGRERDGEDEHGRAAVPLLLAYVVARDPRLVVPDGPHALAVGDHRTRRRTEVDE